MPIAALPDDLRNDLVRFLLSLPEVDDPKRRKAYLQGPFSVVGLPGITDYAPGDILLTVKFFDKLGTLEGGRWPIAMILEQLEFLLPAGDVQNRGVELRRRVEKFYTTKALPDVAVPVPDGGKKLEAVVGGDDRLPYAFLEGALLAAKSVGMISMAPPDTSPSSGTGWLLTPRHIITNWHVVACLVPGLDEAHMKRNLEGASLRFDFIDAAKLGIVVSPLTWVTGDETLDFAILELPEARTDRLPLRIHAQAQLDGKRLNVLQHSLGKPLTFAIRENDYAGSSSAELIHYLSDTEPGASGSPVCDDSWNVVALHHAATRANVVVRERHYDVHNEGIAIKAILDVLPTTVRDQIVSV